MTVHEKLCVLWRQLHRAGFKRDETTIRLDPKSHHDLLDDPEPVRDGSIGPWEPRLTWRGIPVLAVAQRMNASLVRPPSPEEYNEPIRWPTEIAIEYRDLETGRWTYLDAPEEGETA